ncbi:MAG TPA: HD-GYP domain-containing protein [Anaerolineales bacterium]|nr:HD-GYP domain-containing protein [Anaerolineales bacterium]
MITQTIEHLSLHKQIQEVNSMLTSVVARLTLMGNPIVSTAIQDIRCVSESLDRLEVGVNGQFEDRKSQLKALMGIGSMINSSLGKERVLKEVMDSLIALMRAERGFLMLRQRNGELKPEIARGIAHINLVEEEFAFSRTIVHRVAETCEPVLTTNALEDPRFVDQVSIAAYQLRSIICAPLKIKDELIGVVYVDNRARSGIFRESDLDVVLAFANQAAVAIDNADLFDRLQKSNRELEKAYQATLEGWVHALDLKDRETEGHTQRVTVLTERLARSMGVEGTALEHIRRGALLHDIGKMGIPDSILLKRGELTDEEREVIRQHPVYAYQMLRPIEFLRPALDIPYCHHERWDGSGYPRGLKGMEIPFAARIFPVVDVWDAMISDRPYRKGLPHEEVRKQIKADSGRHFDPNVVKAFLDLEDLSV